MIQKIQNPPCGITLTGKVRSHNEDSFLYTDEDNARKLVARFEKNIRENK